MLITEWTKKLMMSLEYLYLVRWLLKKKSSFGVANSDCFFPFLLAGRISKA